jgi:hypothetical protein
MHHLVVFSVAHVVIIKTLSSDGQGIFSKKGTQAIGFMPSYVREIDTFPALRGNNHSEVAEMGGGFMHSWSSGRPKGDEGNFAVLPCV